MATEFVRRRRSTSPQTPTPTENPFPQTQPCPDVYPFDPGYTRVAGAHAHVRGKKYKYTTRRARPANFRMCNLISRKKKPFFYPSASRAPTKYKYIFRSRCQPTVKITCSRITRCAKRTKKKQEIKSRKFRLPFHPSARFSPIKSNPICAHPELIRRRSIDFLRRFLCWRDPMALRSCRPWINHRSPLLTHRVRVYVYPGLILMWVWTYFA
jgi:hypothetical protein